MNTTNQTTSLGDTLITFHVGRRGRFYNAGHLSVISYNKSIQEFTEDLFLEEHNGQLVYFDSSGHNTGLTLTQAEKKTGRIDIDGEYNTIYTTRLKDLTEKETQVVLKDRAAGGQIITYIETELN